MFKALPKISLQRAVFFKIKNVFFIRNFVDLIYIYINFRIKLFNLRLWRPELKKDTMLLDIIKKGNYKW